MSDPVYCPKCGFVIMSSASCLHDYGDPFFCNCSQFLNPNVEIGNADSPATSSPVDNYSNAASPSKATATTSLPVEDYLCFLGRDSSLLHPNWPASQTQVTGLELMRTNSESSISAEMLFPVGSVKNASPNSKETSLSKSQEELKTFGRGSLKQGVEGGLFD